MADYDAILVPGGGLTDLGTPNQCVIARLQAAVAIGSGIPIVCLSAGTPHKPLKLNSSGHPVYESTAGANWLLEANVLSEHVITETASWDTIGNAFFSKVMHTDVRGWRRLMVITSEFHMARTQAIFEHMFLHATGAASTTGKYEIHFQATDNRGLDDEALSARKEREARNLEKWKSHVASGKLESLSDIHAWLYSEHQCYAAGLQPKQETGTARTSY